MSSLFNRLFATLKQGDLVECALGEESVLQAGESLFAVVTQTCDLRNDKRRFVTLAPVVVTNDQEWSTIKKGRRPLLVPVGETMSQAADMERLVTVERSSLAEARVVGHSVKVESGIEAVALGNLLGRVFSKPALPDEVNEVFRKYSNKIADRYRKNNPVAKALDFLEDIRLSCDEWTAPGREITIHYLLPESLLDSSDQIDDSWDAEADPEVGREFQNSAGQANLDKVAAKLCDVMKNNGSLEVKYHFWQMFVERLSTEYIKPSLNEHVTFVDSVVESGDDFSYTLFAKSVSLDLTALTDTRELHVK